MAGRHLGIGLAVLAAGVGMAVVPAIGADHAVTAAQDNTFAPAARTVTTGDTVTFRNGGGAHNIHFEDEVDAPEPPRQSAWERVRKFTAAGEYRFFCDAHGGRGGTGMAGVITVVDPPVVEPGPQPAPAIEEFAAAPLRGSFCVRRGGRCRLPGVVVRMELPRDAFVTGTLERRTRTRDGRRVFRAFGEVAFDLDKGRRSVRFTRTREGYKLVPGHYRLRLSAAGERDVLRFNVRPS